MIPADAQSRKRKQRSPFRSSAEKYRASGFLGTLPLPPGEKYPPPTGYTGGGRPQPTDGQIARWLAGEDEHQPWAPRGNIALRLAEVPPEFWGGRDDLPFAYAGNNVDGWELMGIDVDNYQKGDGPPKEGLRELAELETRLGALPATVLSGARLETGSCIAVFLVPKGYRFTGKAAAAIEIIQKRHRYMMVHPSTNPDADDALYEWASGVPSTLTTVGVDKLIRFDGGLPSIADVTVLPQAWFSHLSHGGMSESDDPISDLTPSELLDWLQGRPGYGDAMCRVMQRATDEWVEKIEASSNSHDMIRNAHWRVLNLAAEGHVGVNAALDAIGEAGYPAALGKRDVETLGSEVNRSVLGALDKIQPRYARANGGTYVPEDTCAVDTSRFDCEGWAARLEDNDEAAPANERNGAGVGRFSLGVCGGTSAAHRTRALACAGYLAGAVVRCSRGRQEVDEDVELAGDGFGGRFGARSLRQVPRSVAGRRSLSVRRGWPRHLCQPTPGDRGAIRVVAGGVAQSPVRGGLRCGCSD